MTKGVKEGISDTTLVAYLQLKGHFAIPWLSRDDPEDPRVEFDIEGDKEKIEQDTKDFYAHAQVDITEYCKQLKSVKSIMYNLKKVGRSS
jgi:hypothetical protein